MFISVNATGLSQRRNSGEHGNQNSHKEIDMTNINRRLVTATALLAAPILIVLGAPTAGATDVQSLIPTPANTQRSDGPNSVQEGGVNEHFLVDGAPGGVMNAYKAALQGRGWTVTVADGGSAYGGGGATFTGTNGTAYGVFTGGGYGSTTDVQACVWPTKPANTDCG
jgi:hypothetical protein